MQSYIVELLKSPRNKTQNSDMTPLIKQTFVICHDVAGNWGDPVSEICSSALKKKQKQKNISAVDIVVNSCIKKE